MWLLASVLTALSRSTRRKSDAFQETERPVKLDAGTGATDVDLLGMPARRVCGRSCTYGHGLCIHGITGTE